MSPSDALAVLCLVFLLTVWSLGGFLSLLAAIRDQKPSPPVLWGEDE